MTHPALVPPLVIERYRILEPHLVDGVTLADIARGSSVSERTLQRWLARYRSEGLSGLARISRADRGRLHLPDHLVRLARDLAIKRPRPPVAAIHRKVQELSVAEGHRPPSYAAVARVVRAIPANQIALASNPAAYRDEHELVHRREGFGLILMGMPGLEKRLARYAQFYSRIGFVHEFKPLTETEMRLLLATHASDFGITFDPAQLDAIEAQAAVIRITRGNFRLMERLFAQMRRIMTLNRISDVSPDIVQAARDCLVIGPGN